MLRHRPPLGLLLVLCALLLAVPTAAGAEGSQPDPSAPDPSEPDPSESDPSEPALEWTLAPSSLVRGTDRTLELVFTPAQSVTSVTTGTDGVALLLEETLSPGQLRLRGVASDEAALQDVDLLLQGESDTTLLPAALRILPGLPGLLRVAPTETTRGEALDILVRGRNLDTVSNWRFEPSLEILDVTVESPTVVSLTIRAGSGAELGPRTLVAAAGANEASLPAAVEVVTDAPSLAGVTPNEALRGQTLMLRIEGSALDRVDEVFLGTRILVEEYLHRAPNRIDIRARVQESAPTGLVPLTLVVDGEALRFPDQLRILPGDLALTSVSPEVLGRNADRTLFINGRNLDGVDSLDPGEGITVLSIDDNNPARLIARLRIAEDAPIGFRTLRATGPHGSSERIDAFRVGPEVLPQVRLDFPPEFSIEDTQRGAIRITSLAIENEGSAPESVELRLDTGDTNVFAIADPDNPLVTLRSLTLTLRPGERADVPLRFAPIIQTSSAAALSIFVRGEEEPFDQIILRARSTPPRLLFGAGPLDVGRTLLPGVTETLEPIRLLVDPIRGGEETRIEDARLLLARDDAWLDVPTAAISWLLTPEDAEGPRTWDATGIDWTWVGAEAGSYRGAFVLRTSDPRAPLMPLPFTFEAAEDSESSTSEPTVPPTTSEPSSPPTGSEEPSTPPGTSPTDPSEEPPEDDDSGCGCSTRAPGSSGAAGLLLLLAALLVRRRACVTDRTSSPLA